MNDILRHGIPLLLSANTIVLMWLVGNRSTLGWLLGVVGQALWFVFIFAWQVWGLLPLATVLTVVYARNLLKWRKEQTERNDNDESNEQA